MSRHPLRRPAVRRLLPPAAALVALSACSFGAPSGATEQGKDIADLYQLMFWIAIGVGAIVLGLILYSVLRFRRRNEDLPKQTHYHLPLEVTYTVIPILIVLFLFAATYHVEHRVDHVAPNPDLSRRRDGVPVAVAVHVPAVPDHHHRDADDLPDVRGAGGGDRPHRAAGPGRDPRVLRAAVPVQARRDPRAC